jgi:hypothetical protein
MLFEPVGNALAIGVQTTVFCGGRVLAPLESRVTSVEDHVMDHVQTFDLFREEVRGRFSGVDLRLHHLDGRMERLEGRMERRFELMDAKISRQFVWLVGLQVTTMATVVAALAAILGR